MIWIILVRNPRELPNREDIVSAPTPEVTIVAPEAPVSELITEMLSVKALETIVIPATSILALEFSKVLPFSVRNLLLSEIVAANVVLDMEFFAWIKMSMDSVDEIYVKVYV